MNSTSPREIVSNAFESIIRGESDPQEEIPRILQQLGSDNYLSVLEELMEIGTGEIRVMACCYLRISSQIDDRRLRASRVLERVLASSDYDEKLATAFWLFFANTATSSMVPELVAMLDKHPKKDNRSIWIAGAIVSGASDDSRYLPELRRAHALLRTALRSEEPYSVVMAARAFGPQNLQIEEVRRNLHRIYASSMPNYRDLILKQLALLAEPNDADVKLITDQALAKRDPFSLRIAAILAMGKLRRSLKIVDACLLRLAKEADGHIVFYAACAYSARHDNALSKEIVHQLIPFLSADDADVRLSTASILSDARDSIREAIPAMVQRLELEEEEQIAQAVLKAFESSDASAIAMICKGLDAASEQRLSRFISALYVMGLRWPVEVAELMDSNNERLRESAAWALHILGPRAAPAIPILARLLHATNEEIILDALKPLCQMGVRAHLAATSVVKLLIHPSDIIRCEASNTLVAIGYDALPAVHAFKQQVRQDQLAVVDEVLSRLENAPTLISASAESGVDGIQDRTKLEVFAVVGDVLIAEGALSFTELAEHFKRRRPKGSDGNKLPLSASNIRVIVRSLESAIANQRGNDVTLVTHGQNRKGSLSPEGLKFHGRVREYLCR